MKRVWVGDWLRAWRELGASSDSTGEALAVMLGLREASQPSPVVEELARAQDDSIPIGEPPSTPHQAHEKPSTSESSARPNLSSRRELVLDGPTQSNMTPLNVAADGGLPAKSRRLPEREFEPLFERRVTRLLLAAIAATRHPEGEIALRAAVELVARRQQVSVLPRRPISTLRAGLVLVLVRRDLEPFSDDLVDLIEQLTRVVGINSVVEWWVDSRGRTPIEHKRSWPPAAGTPVLFVVAPSALAVLDVDARELRNRGCPVIALIPGRPQRTVSLPRHIAIVGWDHRTHVREVVRARQRADSK